MHTTNWIVSFNSIMNTSERNKQMSSPARLYDSFQTASQVSVCKESVIIKAAPMRPVIGQQKIFALLIKKILVYFDRPCRSRQTNKSFTVRLWLYVRVSVFQLAGAAYLWGLKVPGRSKNLGSWRRLSQGKPWTDGGYTATLHWDLLLCRKRVQLSYSWQTGVKWKAILESRASSFWSHFESLVLTRQITWWAKG